MGMGTVSSVHNSLAQWCSVAGLGRADLWKEHSWGSATSAPILWQQHLFFFGVLLLVLLLWPNTRQKQLKEGFVWCAVWEYHPFWWERHDSRNQRQLVTRHAQSWCRGQSVCCSVYFLFFIQSRTPVNGTSLQTSKSSPALVNRVWKLLYNHAHRFVSMVI